MFMISERSVQMMRRIVKSIDDMPNLPDLAPGFTEEDWDRLEHELLGKRPFTPENQGR